MKRVTIEISESQLDSLWAVVCELLPRELDDYRELPEDEQDGHHVAFDLIRIRTLAKRADRAFSRERVPQ